MIYLLYASTAIKEYTKPELDDLVSKGREYNIKHGITSMMLYDKGNLIQMLEGQEKSVRELYEKISRDLHHHEIIKITEGLLAERAFGDMPMGFLNLEDEEVRANPNFIKIMNHPLFDSESNPECVACLDILRGFMVDLE